MKKIILFVSLLMTYNVNAQDACTVDFNGDSEVNMPDLLQFLGAFGAPCNDCEEDLDGNSIVGTADLLPLIGFWGEACNNNQCIGVTNVIATNLGINGGIVPVDSNTDIIDLLHFYLQPITDDLPLTGILFSIETDVSQNAIEAFTLTIGNQTFSVADDGSPYVWFDLTSLVVLGEGDQTECTFSFVKNAWFDAYQGTGEFMSAALFEVNGISCDSPLAFMTPIAGETQYYYFQGISVSLAESNVTVSGPLTIYEITLNITPFGIGAFIDSADGIQVWCSTANYSNTLTSSVDLVFGQYYIEEGATETFTATIDVINPPPNTTVGISEIWYALEFLGTDFLYPTTLTNSFTASN